MTIDLIALRQHFQVVEEATRPEPPVTTPSTDNPPLFDMDANGNPTETSTLPPIEDAFDLVESEMPEPPVLIEGILHQGSKMVIGGGSKSCKTWIQLYLSLCVCSGTKWMGRETKKGKVLFVNFEIHKAFFRKRIKDICRASGIKLEKGMLDVWNLRGYAASYNLLVPQIIERIKDLGYVLVIIDPIYKMYGGSVKDENSATEVAQMMNALETICVKTGVAVIFGAHHSKGNQSQKESIDRIGGSGVYGRDPDAILDFVHHEEENCFTVTPILRNLPPIEPFTVRWDFPLMESDASLDPAKIKKAPGKKPEHNATDFLSFIQDTSKESPISISDWADRAGVKRQTLSNYTPKLRSMGLIQTVGEGTNSRQYITEKGKESVE